MISLIVRKAIKIIKKKRKRNKEIFNENYNQAMKLIDKGKAKKAQKLTSPDVLDYVEVYNKAKSFEDEGNFEKAADLYWHNIIDNGTDAPANFNRLLIVLRKLERYEDELKIA